MGGNHNEGAIYKLTPGANSTWTETLIHNFPGSSDAFLPQGVVFDSSGAIYGMAQGTPERGGLVYQLAPPSIPGGTWKETDLAVFNAFGPHSPYSPGYALLILPNGTVVGTAGDGPSEVGSLFAVTPPGTPGGDWTYKQLFSFSPQSVFGIAPAAGVILVGGKLYGTTTYNAFSEIGCGSVYEVVPPAAPGVAWTGTAIHAFGGSPNDGCRSYAPLAAGPGGVLYGTTYTGGSGTVSEQCSGTTSYPAGCGTVFQLTPPAVGGGAWTEQIIHNFTSTDGDGASPWGPVLVGSDGSLYGTTANGGTSDRVAGCGTIFQLIPPTAPGGAWTEKVLHLFTGQTDGCEPYSGLVMSPAGVLYGTTFIGGPADQGTVFSIRP